MLLSQRLKPRRCPRRRAGIEAGFALCFLPTARRSARLHEAVAAVPLNYSLPKPNPNLKAKPVPAPPGDGRPTPLLIPSPHSGTHRVSQPPGEFMAGLQRSSSQLHPAVGSNTAAGGAEIGTRCHA